MAVLAQLDISGMGYTVAWAGRSIATTFTLSEDAAIEQVQLTLARLGTISTGTVEIWSTIGSPASPLISLGHVDYDGSAWSASLQAHSFSFSPSIEVTAGVYAVVITQSIGTEFNCVKWLGTSGNAGWYNAGAGWLTQTLSFDYIVSGTPADEEPGGPPAGSPPYKPKNPAPANVATSVRLNLALFTWEAGTS